MRKFFHLTFIMSMLLVGFGLTPLASANANLDDLVVINTSSIKAVARDADTYISVSSVYDSAQNGYQLLVFPVGSKSMQVPITPGQLICLRNDIYGEQCYLRAWPDEHFARIGTTFRYPTSKANDGYAVSLRKGKLKLTGLTASMLVLVNTIDFDDYEGRQLSATDPVFIDATGSEASNTWFNPNFSPLTYAAKFSGTAHLAHFRKAPSLPIISIAYIPDWIVTDLDQLRNYDPPIFREGHFSNLAYSADGRAKYVFEVAAPNWDRQLQYQLGSSLVAAPSWKKLGTPEFVTSQTFRIPPGNTLCVRMRFRKPNQTYSTWNRKRCTSRPFDERMGAIKGGFRLSNDNYFNSKHGVLLNRAARIVGPKVLAGSKVGYLFKSNPKNDSAGSITINGGGLMGLFGMSNQVPMPSYWYGTTKKAGRLTIARSGWQTRPQNILGLLVVPPWAVKYQQAD